MSIATASQNFVSTSRPAIDELLAHARSSGTQAEVRSRLAGRSLMVNISATPLRSPETMLLMVRAPP